MTIVKFDSHKTTSTASSLFAKGYELERLGQADEADEYYRCSIDSLEDKLGSGASPEDQVILAHYAFHHGTALEELGRVEHAAAAYRRAIEIWDVLREDGCSSDLIISLARALTAHGRVKRKAKDFSGALESYMRSRRLLTSILSLTHRADPRRENLVKVLSGTLLGGFKAAAALNKRSTARELRRELRRLLGQ